MARLILTVTHADRAILPDKIVQEFGEAGGTIGRGADNTLHLPDPERYVSSRHARIECEQNEFFLVDTSVNGVYIDGAHSPVGRDNRVLLTDGMVIEMGDYTLHATLFKPAAFSNFLPGSAFDHSPSGDPTLRPAEGDLLDIFDPISGLDPNPPAGQGGSRISQVEYESLGEGFFTDSAFDPGATGASARETRSDQQVPRASKPSSIDIPERWDLTDFSVPAPSGDSAPFIPEEWDRTDLGAAAYAPLGQPASGGKSAPAKSAKPSTGRNQRGEKSTQVPPTPGDWPTFPGKAQFVPSVEPAAERKSTSQAPAPLTQEVLATLAQMGVEATPQEAVTLAREWIAAMPVVLEGLIELLRVRAEIKTQLRADKTSIQVDENNPLKFSNTAAVAVESLFLKPRPGFMDAHSALAQVMEDLTLHQKAMTAGVQGGLDALTERLSPKAIEARCAQQKANQGLFSSLSKPDHWRTYCETFDLIMRHSDMSFLDVFGSEFVSAYEQALAKKNKGQGRR